MDENIVKRKLEMLVELIHKQENNRKELVKELESLKKQVTEMTQNNNKAFKHLNDNVNSKIEEMQEGLSKCNKLLSGYAAMHVKIASAENDIQEIKDDLKFFKQNSDIVKIQGEVQDFKTFKSNMIHSITVFGSIGGFVLFIIAILGFFLRK